MLLLRGMLLSVLGMMRSRKDGRVPRARRTLVDRSSSAVRPSRRRRMRIPHKVGRSLDATSHGRCLLLHARAQPGEGAAGGILAEGRLLPHGFEFEALALPDRIDLVVSIERVVGIELCGPDVGLGPLVDLRRAAPLLGEADRP